jgi:hypothetical protein
MTFEPTNAIPGEDDDQPDPQQMADDLPERYNPGRSCGVTATLLAATVALLTALVRKAGAR